MTIYYKIHIFFKLQNICNLFGRNNVHISDMPNCYSAYIKGIKICQKLSGKCNTFEFTLTSDIHV